MSVMYAVFGEYHLAVKQALEKFYTTNAKNYIEAMLVYVVDLSIRCNAHFAGHAKDSTNLDTKLRCRSVQQPYPV